MSTVHNMLILFALLIAGVLAAMLAWANPAHAQQSGDRPRLIISPTELHVGEGESVTYTVHFDKNPVGFAEVSCGDKVYVSMRGYVASELSVEPYIPEFRTGNSNCDGGNWDNPRNIRVMPVDDSEDLGQQTFTISHAVWDNAGGTPVEDTETPKVRVTVYDNDTTEPAVSISAGAGGTEFSNVTFTLTRNNEAEEDLQQPLTVNVSLSETGDMLSGSRSRPVEFSAGSNTATLMVELDDDEVDELSSTIRAQIRAPSG